MYLKGIFLFFMGYLALSVHGLRCYTCTLTVKEGELNPDMRCVLDPANVPGKNTITCPARMKFCTIVRNDYRTTDTISSIERNCSEDPVILNEDIESDELMSHYRACTSDLCNKGTGLEAPDPDGNDDTSGGAMLVPGRSSAVNTFSSLAVIFVLLLLTTRL